MDRLRALRIFTAVAEENGFAAAARRLGLSPPSVTRVIGELEAEIGASLALRTTRSVTLTDAGRRYYEDAKRIIADLEQADRQAAGRHAAPRGRVTVTASALFGRKVVAPALFGLLDAYPEITVATLFVDRVTNLADEGVDIAVRIAHLPDSALIATRVGAVRRVLCASPDYLRRNGRPETPGDLSRHQSVRFLSDSAPNAWTFGDDGAVAADPPARLFANTADVAIAAALDGRGITRVLSYQIADEVAEGRLERVLDDFAPPPVPVHVVHRETGAVSARVRAVVDFLAERLRRAPVLKERRSDFRSG